MSIGIKRYIRKVSDHVNGEISLLSKGNSTSSNGINYAGGLASEGYAGGYRDALADVGLALNGVQPNSRFWNSRICKIKEKEC